MGKIFFKRIFVAILVTVGKLSLAFRYRTEIRGKTNLSLLDLQKGVLFLPNHPALVDPILLEILLWKNFHPKPVVVEYIYRQAYIHGIMQMLGAIPMPDFGSSINEVKIKKVEKILGKISEALKHGKTFILYPSGKLKHLPKESLGGASAVHCILQNDPDVQIVLVRTTGFWGSSFSRAYERKSPDFKKTLKKNLSWILKNGFFFVPKRKILVEFELAPKEFPRLGSRLEVNRFLEKWYNQYPTDQGRVLEEPISLVSYTFWKTTLPQKPFVHKQSKDQANVEIPKIVQDEIFAELSKKHSLGKLQPELELSIDLGLDSLDLAELISFLSLHYDVKNIHPGDLITVRDVLEIAVGRESQRREVFEKIFYWPEEKRRLSPTVPLGKTIPEAFLLMCDRMKGQLACADDLMGSLTYKKLKLLALVLSYELRKIPQEQVGVLLPSSTAAYLVILSLYLAGKVPVLLNWTLGPKYLEEMIKQTHVESVISSWKFLERIGNVEFGEVLSKIVLLEDLKKNISKKERFFGFLQSLKKTPALMKALHLETDEEKCAVILFTSGTETLPKGVPLSHKNILSNQRDAFQCVELKNTDSFYGVLPPFHSFGFSVTGLLPLLTGIKVAYAPDPTDGFALAEGIFRWKITVFCSAPSFLKGLLQEATKKELETVRLFVTGAEKAPLELFERVQKLGRDKKIIEGYGITECSPILTLNRPTLPSKSVGQPIPNVEFCVIDPETEQLLPQGKEGEFCVRGPNVFHGYLGKQKDPFIWIEGKAWYRTGDLGFLDPEGFVILRGRLKRCAKIGGELVSLNALEESLLNVLSKKYPNQEDGPFLALCSHEIEGEKTHLVLFVTIEVEKSEINEILKYAGYSYLVKISKVQKVEKIPLLGTGKIDYRSLQRLIERSAL